MKEMDILENPKFLKKMEKSLRKLLKEKSEGRVFVTCLLDGKEMRMEQINIFGRIGYYLTPATCPLEIDDKIPYAQIMQHLRKKGSPGAVFTVDELIEIMEKGNYEIK